MRRAALALAMLAALVLAACQPRATQGCKAGMSDEPAAGRTEVFVLGMLHGPHRTSERYSLERMRQVVGAIDPDIILTELPIDRYETALQQFRETGTVTESRARAFPEYVDAIIPMTRDHDFRIVGTAGWTPEIAAERAAIEKRLAADPARADEWREWEASQAEFRKAIAGHTDDPLFIHSCAYDDAARARYAPYVAHFDKDLGEAGWNAINAAHWTNISAELDRVKGKDKRVLITYGALHKHRILERLYQRDDVVVRDPVPYFERNEP